MKKHQKKIYEQREESQKKDEIEIVKNGYSIEAEIGRIFIIHIEKREAVV